MSFYFPFNYRSVVSSSIVTSSLAQSSATASFSASFNNALQTFYASTVKNIGPSGPKGPDKTGCVGTVQGPTGSVGPTGSRGQAVYDCPAGYIPCPNLNVPDSLYSIVCIPLPVPCNGTTQVCPCTHIHTQSHTRTRTYTQTHKQSLS